MVEVRVSCSDVFTIDQYCAGGWFFETVTTAQQGAFSRAGWPDHENQLSFVDAQVDALEHFVVTEGFV